MIKSDYSFDELKFSSQVVRDLIDESPSIQPFINSFYNIDGFTKQISEKSYNDANRQVLAQAALRQNEGINLSNKSKLNIQLLSDSNTYTITTGHQLNLLTGPLYSIYKAAQVISITEKLNELNKDFNFVPVFWMATEDHDFEEINHIHLFGKKIEWSKEDQINTIAGRIQTAQISGFLNEIEEKFGDPAANKIVSNLLDSYRSTNDLAGATRHLMNQLFGGKGLVIIDGDDRSLKALFKPVLTKEIQESFSRKAVDKSNSLLESSNYHQQVFVRDCNLFYIDETGTRHRIKKEGESFEIKGKVYQKDELLDMINEEPENFSPNALLRPVYQETILPNLAYVGGGGEIAYWMQLKGVFDELGLTYPMLKVRDSILILTKKQTALLDENKIDLLDLKIGVSHLIKDIAIEEANPAIDLSEPKKLIQSAQEEINQKAKSINQGLINMIEAEFSKFSKSIERIEAKLIKAEKGKFEVLENKLNKLSTVIYPEGGFQERFENFIPYLIKHPTFIDDVIAEMTANEPSKIRILIKD